MVEQHDVRSIIRRELHLNSLAYLIIVSLLVLVGILVFMLLTGIEVPHFWLLDNEIFRALFTGLLLMVILYMADQHRRLRTQLLSTHDRLQSANAEIEAAYERLAFAQHAAEIMTSLDQADPLDRVLRESATHFDGEAVAVVGEEVTLHAVESVDDDIARRAVMKVALDAVRAGKPLSISNAESGSQALAVPLRFHGELQSVLCLWRRERPFEEDHLYGLGLIARIIELSGENRILLAEANARLTGTLNTLAALIDGRVPGYVKRSARMAEQAAMVGRALGMSARELADLRIAATLTDVGMLDVPESIIMAKRSLTPEETARVRLHAEKGAQVAHQANFSTAVQQAIRDHHERLDGSGYPRRRGAEQIGLAARILAVCGAYNSMTADRPHRQRLTGQQAVTELVRHADTHFDRRVLGVFLKSLGYTSAGTIAAPAVTPAEEPGSLVLAATGTPDAASTLTSPSTPVATPVGTIDLN